MPAPALSHPNCTLTGCLNGGTCQAPNCVCPANYTGTICEMDVHVYAIMTRMSGQANGTNGSDGLWNILPNHPIIIDSSTKERREMIINYFSFFPISLLFFPVLLSFIRR